MFSKTNTHTRLCLFFICYIMFLAVGGPVLSEGQGIWVQKEVIPQGARYGNSVASMDGKIYCMGGYNTSALTLNQVYHPGTGQWETKAPMLIARSAFATVVWDGKIYAIGGVCNGNTVAAIDLYDPETNTWSFVTNLLVPSYGHRAEVVDGVIYVMGGRNSNNQYFDRVEAYDINTGIWSIKPSLPGGIRYYFGSTVVNGLIYAIGGLGNGSVFMNRVDVYDPVANLWTSVAAMPTARDFLETVSVHGKIYAIGGLNSNGPLNLVEEYNPITDTWATKAGLNITRRAFGAAVSDSKIYAVAGVQTSGFLLTDSMEEYTPVPPPPDVKKVSAGDGRVTLNWNSVVGATGYRVQRSTSLQGTYNNIADLSGNTYTDTNVVNGIDYYYRLIAYNAGGESTVPATTVSRPAKAEYPWTASQLALRRSDLVTVAVNGKIYAIGGLDQNKQILQTVEEYDPVAGTWTIKASIPSLRKYYGAAAVNGKIYVIGGETGSGQVLATVEEYDPVQNRWATKASMPTARTHIGITSSDGKIFVCGGRSSSGYLTVLEEYDPSDLGNGNDIYGNPMGYWTSRSSMTKARSDLGLAVIDGNLYAVGGYSNFGLDKVEVYHVASDAWSNGVNLPIPWGFFGTTVVGDRIYVIGGYQDGKLTNKVISFDPARQTWSDKPSLIDYRTSMGVAVVERDIYVIGGGGGLLCWDSLLYTVEKYHPEPLTTIAVTDAITLKWYGVYEAVSYTVKRASTPGTAFVTVAQGLTQTAYTDTDVVPNGSYYYIVLAVDAAGKEVMVSNEAWAIFGLAPPSGFQAISVAGGIKLTWNGVSNAQGYKVKRSVTPGGPYVLISDTQTTYITITCSGTYYYVVCAYNGNGQSPDSEEISATL